MATRNAKSRTAAIRAKEEGSVSSIPESVDSVHPVIEHDEIARLAYSYWQARGFYGGSAEDDWLRAEQELKKRTAAANQVDGRTRRRLCG